MGGGYCQTSYPHLAQVEGVEGEVSGLAVLLVHVDDGGEEDDLGKRDPEQKLPHGAIRHLSWVEGPRRVQPCYLLLYYPCSEAKCTPAACVVTSRTASEVHGIIGNKMNGT